MVLRVLHNSVWVELDLFPNAGVTADYNIFPTSTVSETGVSYTSTFTLPMTAHNKAILDSKITGNQSAVMSCQLESSYDCDDSTGSTTVGDYYEGDYNEDYFTLADLYGTSIKFNGDMYIDKIVVNVTDEVYEVMIVDSLKTSLDGLDESLSDLFADNGTESFPLRVDATKAHIPVSSATTSFFFTSANYCGSPYDANIDGIPMYPAKMGDTDIFQVYWTWRYFDILSTIFTHYSIPYAFIETDKVTDVAQLNNLYVGVSAPLAVDNTRYMAVELLNEDGDIRSNTDYGDQTKLTPVTATECSYIVGTCDTKYEVTVDITSVPDTVEFIHQYKNNSVGACPDEWIALWDEGVPLPATGTAYLTINIFSGEDEDGLRKLVKTYDVAELDTSEGHTMTPSLSESFTMEMTATTKYFIRYGIRFKDYTFTDGTISYDGTCRFNQLDDYTLNGEQYEIPNIILSRPYVNINYAQMTTAFTFTAIKCRTPLSRDGFVENISPKLSLSQIDLTSKDVIEDILKRYNLGVWYNVDGEMLIGRYQDRYVDGIVDLRGLLTDEKRMQLFSQDLIRKFAYKNKSTKTLDYKLSKFDFEEEDITFSYGDILETVVNESGQTDLSLSLRSSNFYVNNYGANVTEPYAQLLVVNSVAFWGLGENEQLTIKDTGVVHGYLETIARNPNIRLAYVMDEYDFMDDPQPEDEYRFRVTYTPYTEDDSGTTTIPVFYMTSEIDGVDTLFFGNEDGEFNVSPIQSSVIPNFEVLFDITSGALKRYIEVEVPLDICNIIRIINGHKVMIDETSQVYLPIEMSGVQFNKKHSIVKLKLIEDF